MRRIKRLAAAFLCSSVVLLSGSAATAQWGPVIPPPIDWTWLNCYFDYFDYIEAHPRFQAKMILATDLKDGVDGTSKYDYIHTYYVNWPAEWQQRVGQHFADYCAGYALDLDTTPPLENPSSGHMIHNGYATMDQGRDVYFANIAWSIYADYEGLFGWALEDHTDSELYYIFSSMNYFRIYRDDGDPASPQYYVTPMGAAEMTTENILGDPREVLAFLESDPELGGNLVGATPWETAENLTEWLHDYLWHKPGAPFDFVQFFHDYPYLEDRLEEHYISAHGRFVYMAPYGCWSTSSLFADVMRVVNIPIRKVRNQLDGYGGGIETHSGMLFDWQGGSGHGRYILHTDDIYTHSQLEDPIPIVGDSRGRAIFDNVWMNPSLFGDTIGYDYPAPDVFTHATIAERERATYRAKCNMPTATALPGIRYQTYSQFAAWYQARYVEPAETEACWDLMHEVVYSWGAGDWEAGFDAILDDPDSLHNEWCDRTGKC